MVEFAVIDLVVFSRNFWTISLNADLSPLRRALRAEAMPTVKSVAFSLGQTLRYFSSFDHFPVEMEASNANGNNFEGYSSDSLNVSNLLRSASMKTRLVKIDGIEL